MKKLLLVLTAIVFMSSRNAYETSFPFVEGKIKYTHTEMTKDTLSDSLMYLKIEEWVSTKSSKFQRGNKEPFIMSYEYLTQLDILHKNTNPVLLKSKDSRKFVCKVVNTYHGLRPFSCIYVIYVEYEMIIQYKEGKFKCDITNFTYTHYNPVTGRKISVRGADEGDCKSKGDLEDLINCERCKSLVGLFNYLNLDTKELENEFISYMSKSVSNDW